MPSKFNCSFILFTKLNLDLGEGEIFNTEKDVPPSLVWQKITLIDNLHALIIRFCRLLDYQNRPYSVQYIFIQRLDTLYFSHNYSKRSSIVFLFV